MIWLSATLYIKRTVFYSKSLLFTSISYLRKTFKLKEVLSWIKVFFFNGGFPLTYNIIWFWFLALAKKSFSNKTIAARKFPDYYFLWLCLNIALTCSAAFNINGMKLSEGHSSLATVIPFLAKPYQETNFKFHFYLFVLKFAMKLKSANYKSYWNISVFYEQLKMSNLNISHGKMTDFVSIPLFGFTLVIKLGNFNFESHWNTLISFYKKCMVSDLNISDENISDFISLQLFRFIL